MTFGATLIRPAQLLAFTLILLALAGCQRKHGQAVVRAKEHIAAAAIPATPSAAPENSIASPTPAATPAATDAAEGNELPGEDKDASPEDAEAAQPDQTARELKPGEIVVDGYVMDEKDRGTSKDPRALADEQWLVRVELISGGRKIDIRADRKQYEKVNPGDHVEITYREGKYTGTVWSAEID